MIKMKHVTLSHTTLPKATHLLMPSTKIGIPAAIGPIHALLVFLLPELNAIFFPSHRLLSHTTILENRVSFERK